MFEKHLGPGKITGSGVIEFDRRENCTLGYAGKNSLMSRNYYLSLQSRYKSDSVSGRKASHCYLNRLGSWRFKGTDETLRQICDRIRKSPSVRAQLRKTDVESVSLNAAGGEISLSINLYGGGFSSVLMPPMHVRIGVPENQIDSSVKLLGLLRKEVSEAIRTS